MLSFIIFVFIVLNVLGIIDFCTNINNDSPDVWGGEPSNLDLLIRGERERTNKDMLLDWVFPSYGLLLRLTVYKNRPGSIWQQFLEWCKRPAK